MEEATRLKGGRMNEDTRGHVLLVGGILVLEAIKHAQERGGQPVHGNV